MAAKDITDFSYAELVQHLDLLKKIPKDKKLIDISEFDKLKKNDERINVLDCDTVFDDFLKYLLMLRFSREGKDVMKLFEPSIGGPLVSLTHKARLAYALGIIDKTALNDYEYVHKIRNEFAHSTETSFGDTNVINHVQKLSPAKGHKATAKNSFNFFLGAQVKCLKWLKDAYQQEIYRLAAIESLKEKEQEAKSD